MNVECVNKFYIDSAEKVIQFKLIYEMVIHFNMILIKIDSDFGIESHCQILLSWNRLELFKHDTLILRIRNSCSKLWGWID